MVSTETCMWGKRLAAMLAIYTGRGVAPEVNLREHISCTPPPSANKAAHSGFETQRRHHQGYQWPQISFFFKNKNKKTNPCTISAEERYAILDCLF